MNRDAADIAVIGAGIMGSSAAWQLSRRGHRVTVFEQFELDHTRGSSHGAGRIFRLAYPQTDYVRLAQMARPEWHKLERELEQTVLDTTGALDFGPPGAIHQLISALSDAGARFERYSRTRAERRFGVQNLPETWEAILQPDGGVSSADLARAGLLHLAEQNGAKVEARTSVLSLGADEEGASLETTRGIVHADTVVVTAAGWSNRLLAPLGLAVSVTPTRETVVYYDMPAGGAILPSIWHTSPENPFYWLPNGPRREFKGGWHGVGPAVDPDSEASLDSKQERDTIQFFSQHIRGLSSSPRSSETCLYASTPDDDFVLDRSGRIVIATGFGGHGFKFGPVIGKIVADMVEGQPPPFADRFSRARFASAATT